MPSRRNKILSKLCHGDGQKAVPFSFITIRQIFPKPRREKFNPDCWPRRRILRGTLNLHLDNRLSEPGPTDCRHCAAARTHCLIETGTPLPSSPDLPAELQSSQ
jgi:hypothetical protein